METEKKLNFFQRIFVAVFRLEEYGIFLLENISEAIKYFFLLIFILTVILGMVNAYTTSKMITKAYDYVYNELPDFKMENDTLTMEKEVDAYDHEYELAFAANTNLSLEDANSEEVVKKLKNGRQSVVLLKDGFIYGLNTFDGENVEQEPLEVKYSSLTEGYEEIFASKETLVKYLDNNPISNLVVTYSVVNVIVGYLANIISIALDVLLISMIGYCISRIFAKVFLNIRAILVLGTYSMTLPIFVTMIYSVINALTGFTIVKFNLMYELIGCVYLIAAIYMIKYDLIKQNEELEKIIMVENQIRKEKEEEEDRKAEEELKRREEQKKKEKEKKKDKKDEIDAGEPDGSEI